MFMALPLYVLLVFLIRDLRTSILHSYPANPANNRRLLNRYFPGWVHAFYLEYVYYTRRNMDPVARSTRARAPGIFSERVQRGETI